MSNTSRRGRLAESSLEVDGRCVAPLLVANDFWSKARGLLGRSGLDGAMLICSTSSVHTFGMQFALDVAFCDDSFEVLAVARAQPNRLVPRVKGTRHVLEAEAGAFTRWGIVVHSQLTMPS